MVRFAAAAIALAASLLGLSAHGSPILLLEFSTPTCGPCQQMKPLIDAFEQAGYPIRQVDASREPQLAQQYNVTRYPTFVMLVNGREFTREIGKLDSQRLQQLFQSAKDEFVRSQPPKDLQAVKPLPQLTADQRPAPHAAAPDNTQDNQQPGVDLAPDRTTDDETSNDLINATVRLRVDDAKVRSFGTGTIIDAREGEALIITCGHLFRDSKGKDPVTVEMFEATRDGVRPVGEVSGWVFSYDLDRDVALVVIRPGRPVGVAPIAPAGSVIERGDRAVSVGCSNGQDPTVMSTRVTQLDRYQGAPNIEASGAPVEGRSGGGLFNDQGELIGVCFAADYEGNEGLYAALESIHDEVARLNLKSDEIDSTTAAVGPTTPSSARSEGANPDPVYRGQGGQEMSGPGTPPGRESLDSVGANATGPTGGPGVMPDGLNDAEQTAWEHIVPRAATSEVVIIVRPPGGESEMFTLDGASPAFVRALAELRRDHEATIKR